jgi:YggT family protein
MISSTVVSLTLSILLGLMIFLFIIRIVLTWYPQVELKKFPFSLVAIPTEPFLTITRKLIPPMGLFSLAREILLGQQGLLTMLN